MFVKTQSNMLVQLKDYIKASKTPSPNGTYNVTLCSKCGLIVLGEYDDVESAANVITLIAYAIESQKPLLSMPRDAVFSNEKLQERIKRF